MDRRDFIVAAGSVTAVASASQASEWFMRGAFLDHAVPGVGLTVSGPVREVRLYFDRGGCRRDFGWNLSSVISGATRLLDHAARSIA
jgi:hypothetical protein